MVNRSRKSYGTGITFWLWTICVLGAGQLRADAPVYLEQEISKSSMTVEASNTYGSTDVAERAIDDTLSTYWQTRATLPQWIQLDLGDARWVSRINIYSGGSYRIRGYEVYVANEADPEDWGAAVATGELLNETGWTEIPFDSVYGRYLRLVVTSRWTDGRIYLYEMRVFELGVRSLADQQTGSVEFTNGNTVDVRPPRVAGEYDEYQLTDSDVEPVGGWLPYDADDLPDNHTHTFTEPLEDTRITRYVWFRDSGGVRATGAIPTDIIYTTEPPIVNVHATREVFTYAGEPLVISIALIDDGSTGGTSTVEAVEHPIGIHHIGISTGGGPSGDTLSLAPGLHTVTLTVTNSAGTALTDTSQVTVTDAGDATTTGSVTWSGGAGGLNPEWFRGQNWSAGVPPANPTTGTINYGVGGADVSGLLAGDRQVGGVLFNHESASHTLDLGGNTLTVAGLFRNRFDGIVTLTNGTLQIGTDTVTGNLTVGSTSQSASSPMTLRLQPGMTFAPYRVGTIRFDTETATHVNHQNTRLDLRGVTVAGGVLGAENILLDTNRRHSGGSYIAIDATTALSAIAVTNEFRLDGGQRRGRVFIGDPADPDRRLPPNIDIFVGVNPAQRGSFLLAHNCPGDERNRDVKLAASEGGRIEAYLDELIVMRFTGNDPRDGVAPATLDLSAMTNCVIDTLHIETGVNVPGLLAATPQGTIKLPAGTLTAGTAVIGAWTGHDDAFGRFETSNTVVTVTNSLLLDLTGEITINIGGEPMGIDVDGTFTDGGGRIHVNFLEAPLVAASTNWAFRVAGDVSSTLNAMVGSERLTSSGTFAGWQTAVITDDSYTYFALVDENMAFPPVAVAQDVTFELEPAGTVWVDVSEVDAGSFDPSDRTPVAITMSSDGSTFDTNLSFTVVDVHPVTIKIEVGTPVVDEDTDTATVSIVALDPGTPDDVTWLGAASTVLMDRREWWWSGSWLDGVPPTNPTPGTITFDQFGQDVVGLLEQDRQVGGISLPDASYDHTLDLNGHVLTVAGDFVNELRGTLTFTNGTLRIGTDETAGNLLFGGTSGTSSPSVADLRPGMTFDPYRMDTLRLGLLPVSSINNQNARLDLRGVTVTDGVLKSGDIIIVNTYRHGSGSYIALDATTVLDAIVATNALRVGVGTYQGRSFIGDPTDPDRRLPPDIDIRVGVDTTQRGLLEVGVLSTAGSQTANITLAASSSGSIEAYLTDLTVMRQSGIQTAELNGTLDLSAMTNCLIDVTTVTVGRNTNAGEPTDVQPRGTLRLPPGMVTAGTVIVGDNHSSGFGLLTMSNTAFTVTNTLTIARTGDIEVRVGGLSSGLDIQNADPGALSVHTDATLSLVFFAPAEEQPLNAFRWAGDHRTTLETMVDDGRLVIDDAGLAGKSAVIYMAQGDTHVGIAPPAGSLFLLR